MKTKLLIAFAFCTFNLFSQTNLVPNGGFETWTNSTTLSNWTIENSVTQNTTYFTEGSKSTQLSITNSTAKPEITAQVPMTAGKTYTVKFKYKYVNANYSGQHPIALNISQNGSATTLSSSTFASDNNWTVKETTFTPDQNLSYDLSISLFTFDAAAFNVLIDDVQVYIQGTEQYTLIPDVNFEKKLIALGIDSGTTDGKVLTNSVNKLTSLNVSSSSIIDLTGIQDFVALTTLNCYNNQLSALDVSKNIVLTNLSYFNNKITAVDLSKNISLKSLDCGSNPLTTFDVSKNIALTFLTCYNNQLTAIDVSKNVALTYLECGSNKLTTLDVSKNISLATLSCNSNQLPVIDVSKNLALSTFICSDNLLTSLDVTKNVVLTYLDFNYNKLPVIDVSKNLSLSTLVCNNNLLTAIDVSKNVSLTTLQCNSNLLTTLDVSKNTALAYFYCYTNKLTSLNLKNGKNNLLTNVNINLTGNANLSCIIVDDAAYSNTNWSTKKDATATYSESCSSTYTLIPDINFEKTLIAKGIDSGVTDGKVLTSNVIAVTDLFISSKSISDLTGIQDFTSLINFECDNNNLTDIDVSNNTKLKFLSVGGNQLTKLNVSKNTDLTDLYFHENQISSIDVSQNTALKMLYFTKNTITNIDVTNNPILTHLHCNSNQLTTLNVSKNTALTNLTCDHNQLTNLDISNNTLLGAIDCNSNQLKSLNTSKNTVLIRIECATNQITSLDTSKNPLHILNCSSNQLTDLDLSMNTGLNFLFCNNNQLTSLNLKNGNNSSFGNMGDNFKYNPNLTCIQVDDVAFSNKNWANAKDATASYSILCENQIILIADPNFEQKLIDLGIDSDGLNGKITVADSNHVTNLDLSNSNITNLSGIENFTALTYLNCSNNQLTTLDLSQNILLETLDASSNQITSLDLSKNGKLTIVYVVSNPLLYLNLQNGNNTNMIILNVTGKNAANNITTTFLGLDKLACVKVDDAVFSNANWSKIKEESTVYSTTCTLGIEDSIFDKVAIYPNPTNGELHIDNIVLEKATVYDALGKLVKTATFNSGANDNMIHLTGLPKGIYYVYLESEGANTAKKIIVE